MTTPPPVRPDRIHELSNSIFEPLALLGAMKLDLFTPLKNGALEAEQLAEQLKVNPERLQILLHALVVTGLLEKRGTSFRNSDEAQTYLVSDSPHYVGFLAGLFAELWPSGFKTAETLLSGKPGAAHDYATMSGDELKAYYSASLPGASASARQFQNLVDLENVKRILDIGGGSGGLLIGLLQLNTGLTGTLVDHPNSCEIASQFIREAGLSDRLDVFPCDILRQTPEKGYDLAVMRNFIQVQSEVDAATAIRNTAKCILTGGRLVIWGWAIENDRLNPKSAALHNLVYLNFYEGGQVHTIDAHKSWLRSAGFGAIEHRFLPGGPSLFSAVKE